jgi:hypothetical protein
MWDHRVTGSRFSDADRKWQVLDFASEIPDSYKSLVNAPLVEALEGFSLSGPTSV